MKYVLFFIAIIAAQATAQDKKDVQVSPEIAARCEAEGGCVLISRDRINEVVKAALKTGFDEGKKNGICRRDSV